MRMTDFEYDVMQKKRIARCASSRKRGSKSRKCTLPSDWMTEKQWKERNGAVINYNMNKPMDWATFKAAPADIQEEYLRHLMARFGMTGGLAAKMFGISYSTLYRHIQNAIPDLKFPKGKAPSSAERARIGEFLAGEDEVSLLEPDVPWEETAEGPQTDDPEEPDETDLFRFKGFSTEFETVFDPADFCNSILATLPAALNGRKVSVRVEVDVL